MPGLLFGGWLVGQRCVGISVGGLASAFGWVFRGRYRCVAIVDDAWLADAFACDWLHGLVHVDVEFIAGSAARGCWFVDGLAGTWSGCVLGSVARRLGDIKGRLVEEFMVLPVVFLRILELAWIFALRFTVLRGFAPEIDFPVQDYVLVLPFHHGLLSIECGVIEGIVGERFVICEGRDELLGVWRRGTRRGM